MPISYKEAVKNKQLSETFELDVCMKCRKDAKLIRGTRFCKPCYDKIYTNP